MDSLGAPQSVLILGGSSDLGWAILQGLPSARLRRVTLAGRPSPLLESRANTLKACGVTHVDVVGFDALNTDSHKAVIDAVFNEEDVDVVILAFGQLGDQTQMEAHPDTAVLLARVNYVGAVSAGLHVARRLRTQGHGTLVVLSSVAADRPRKINFIYGSTKAGLDSFAQGLGDSLHGSGARVIVVRPGYVRTRMTTGLPEAPLSTDPEVVGALVAKAVRSGRETVYAPGPLRLVMTGLKALPRPLFRKISR